ncbi:ATP-binding cassette domain-containing protein [Streptomyces sp. URMC 123]|uniref:ABC transporter ATP-binding protein n=1 Tax=Streptomyces sp. URMC 123 TaxID=3423403 RepID=UPI003F1ADEA9
MIQAIGLTSMSRRNRPPAVDDLTFEACPGRVTVLLGGAGAGKTSALRLILRLDAGRGVALFRGRPLHRVPHPSREIGVLLGDVPGHPARTGRGHLRMLAAAAGVPSSRADELLDAVGLGGLADQRLATYSLGMDRRLGLATALLGDPHTLVLDEPAKGLSAREVAWVHEVLRDQAARGRTVLVTSSDLRETARIADRVVVLDAGRLVADQDAADFARGRLRPRVVVRTPHAARLAALLTAGRPDPAAPAVPGGGTDKSPGDRAGAERADGGAIEVEHEGGSRIAVYGSTCAAVGEIAYRHGIVVHQLADERGDTGAVVPLRRADGRDPAAPSEAPPTASRTPWGRLARTEAPARPAPHGRDHRPGSSPDSPTDTSPAPSVTDRASETARSANRPAGPRPAVTAARRPRLAPPSPVWPLRYELRRALGVPTTWVIAVIAVAASALTAVVAARTGTTSPARLLAGWPELLPLPPAALGAGLLGALAFGQEYRYPALAHAHGRPPRRLGLLAAKLAVATAAALLLALFPLALNDTVLGALADGGALPTAPERGHGVGEGTGGGAGAGGGISASASAAAGAGIGDGGSMPLPDDWPLRAVAWAGLVTGCAWAGVLAAALGRSTAMGMAAVLAVPVVVLPAVQRLAADPAARALLALPARLRELPWPGRPTGVDRGASMALRLASQPVGQALALSLALLLTAYLLMALRGRPR